MNRKLIALFAAGLSCGTLFADDVVAGEDGTAGKAQTFCRIKIDSGRKETVLAIPLTTADGNEALDVTKFVLTTNLKAGDKLGKKTNGNWEYWTLTTDETSGNLYWKSDKTTSENGSTQDSSTSIAVGDCIKLTRTGTNLSDPFYLYGLIPAISDKEQTAAKDEWTLIGNPNPESTKISDIVSKASVASFETGDKIILMPMAGSVVTEYVYNGSKWIYYTYGSQDGFLTFNENDAGNIEIPAGEGFFFIAKSSDRKFTWNKTN